MSRIPPPPSYASTRKEWETYRDLVLTFSENEPGRNGAMAEITGMLREMDREDAVLPIAA